MPPKKSSGGKKKKSKKPAAAKPVEKEVQSSGEESSGDGDGNEEEIAVAKMPLSPKIPKIDTDSLRSPDDPEPTPSSGPPVDSPGRDLSDVSANMMSPRAGENLLQIPKVAEPGNDVSRHDLESGGKVVDTIPKARGFPDAFLLAHCHVSDPEGPADAFATLSVCTTKGKHVPLGKHQLGPLLRRSSSLSGLALVPPDPNDGPDTPPEYVAWSPDLAALIHFRLHGATGGSIADLKLEEVGRFPVPFPRFKPPPDIADDEEACKAAKPRHRPLSFSIYREAGSLYAVYHSPGGDLKRLEKGADGSGYGSLAAGLTPTTGVGLWIARVVLCRVPERNNLLQFDRSVVPGFGKVERIMNPPTVIAGCHAAGSAKPLIRLTSDAGTVFSAEGRPLAVLKNAGHVRAIHGSPEGCDVFSNLPGGKTLWTRLHGERMSECDSVLLTKGSGCVSAAAPFVQVRSKGGAAGAMVSPRGQKSSGRKGGTIRKAQD